MVAAPDRKESMLRTFQAAFAALDDMKHKDHASAHEVFVSIVAHVRSSNPQALLVETGPIAKMTPDEIEADDEIEKLRAECEHMRGVFVAALMWREGGCSDGFATTLVHAIDAVTPTEEP